MSSEKPFYVYIHRKATGGTVFMLAKVREIGFIPELAEVSIGKTL